MYLYVHLYIYISLNYGCMLAKAYAIDVPSVCPFNYEYKLPRYLRNYCQECLYSINKHWSMIHEGYVIVMPSVCTSVRLFTFIHRYLLVQIISCIVYILLKLCHMIPKGYAFSMPVVLMSVRPFEPMNFIAKSYGIHVLFSHLRSSQLYPFETNLKLMMKIIQRNDHGYLGHVSFNKSYFFIIPCSL